MKRIKALAEELPSVDDLDALGQVVTDIAGTTASIKEMKMPAPDAITD
jgi:hypothetical protein